MSNLLSFNRFSNYFYNIRHPILTILAVGLAIRLIMMSLAVVYDADYWALVLRNLKVGEGLYGLEGYYYTPVWGYVLGMSNFFQSLLLDIGEFAVRVVDLIPIEGIEGYFLSATVPSLALNYAVKMPLIISDVVLSLLVYILVRDLQNDTRKAILACALVFLCPLLIGSSAIIGMPDTISATFAILTLLLAMRGRYFLAGMSISIAVLTKFFPVFFIFILIAYVLRKHHDNCSMAYKNLFLAIAGGVIMTLIIFLPQIITDNLDQCFKFLFDRTGSSVDESILGIIAGKGRIIVYLAVIVITMFFAYRLYHSDEKKLDQSLVKYCFITVALCMLYPPAPQYMVLLIPFLAYMICIDKKFMLSWKVFFFSAFLFIGMTNALLFTPLAVWTNLISIESVVYVFNLFQTTIGPLTLMDIQYIIAGTIQYVGILLLVWSEFGDRIKRRVVCGMRYDRDRT